MYWSFSDVICRIHALSQEHTMAEGGETRVRVLKKRRSSNYFKSRHLAFMNNLVSTIWRRHAVCKSAVLNSSPALHISYVLMLCYRFRCLFYTNVSALRSGDHRIFRHDSSSKQTYSIQSAYKCARRELKLYISEVYDVTLICAWRRCATQTMNEISEVK